MGGCASSEPQNFGYLMDKSDLGVEHNLDKLSNLTNVPYATGLSDEQTLKIARKRKLIVQEFDAFKDPKNVPLHENILCQFGTIRFMRPCNHLNE